MLGETASTHTVSDTDIAAMAGGKYLVCEVTVSNWQGSDSDTDYSIN